MTIEPLVPEPLITYHTALAILAIAMGTLIFALMGMLVTHRQGRRG